MFGSNPEKFDAWSGRYKRCAQDHVFMDWLAMSLSARIETLEEQSLALSSRREGSPRKGVACLACTALSLGRVSLPKFGAWRKMLQ